MNSAEIEKKNFEMPPRDGFTIAYFLTVADVGRSTSMKRSLVGAF